jgi:hypothetical protein
MKKVLLALSVFAAALVIPAAFAGGPAPKATGDFSYVNPWVPGLATHITFVAQDLGGGSAKGNFSYVDSIGSYQADVTAAHVSGNTATFTVKITSSTGAYAPDGSQPRPAGMTADYQVVDNGEPGVNDTFTYLVGGNSYPLGPLTAGNIQVH